MYIYIIFQKYPTNFRNGKSQRGSSLNSPQHFAAVKCAAAEVKGVSISLAPQQVLAIETL